MKRVIYTFAVLMLLWSAEANARFGAIPIPSAHRDLTEGVAEHNIAWVEGAWQVSIMMATRRCRWEGTVVLKQRQRQILGSGAATGRRGCADLHGRIKGEVEGARVGFGFATGALGTARFRGTMRRDGKAMHGEWNARNASGAWTAVRARN